MERMDRSAALSHEVWRFLKRINPGECRERRLAVVTMQLHV